MAPNTIPLGYLGNLTADQEGRLQQFWALILHLGDSDLSTALPPPPDRPGSNDRDSNSSNNTPPSPTLSRRNSWLTRTDSKLSRRASTLSAISPPPIVIQNLRNIGMSSSEIKTASRYLAHLNTEDLRWHVLAAAKNEPVDACVLRFLRYCKWKVRKAFLLLLDSIVWRTKVMHVDDHLIPRGELHALHTAEKPGLNSELAGQFMDQLRMGKCYIHGVDRQNRPICVIRVRLHRPADQSEMALNQFITHIIESCRLVLTPPNETATVIFDMTEFSLANMEYAPVKFVIRCFEAFYPESLGVLLIHNAPRVFAGIWKIIKGWIDPDLVTKIHFTRNVDDLEEFIPRTQIVRELGGAEEWEYNYTEPKEDENLIAEDTEARDAYLAERQELGEELFSLTTQWIASAKLMDPLDVLTIKNQRTEIMDQLRSIYWTLDPYIRARNYLDRTGVIQEGGKVVHYPPSKPLARIETAQVLQVAQINPARVKLVNV